MTKCSDIESNVRLKSRCPDHDADGGNRNRDGTENEDDIDQLHGDNSNVSFIVKRSSTLME